MRRSREFTSQAPSTVVTSPTKPFVRWRSCESLRSAPTSRRAFFIPHPWSLSRRWRVGLVFTRHPSLFIPHPFRQYPHPSPLNLEPPFGVKANRFRIGLAFLLEHTRG